ncbi:MAG: bestrophin family ion channel, partial [Synechococcus sp.]|nr:bestrophin family ion channel [Synechococcus sp.]
MKLDLLLVALLCGITLALEPQGLIKRIDIIDVGGLTIMGTAVSILLALRNSEAISRWWEARTLWGAVTNVSRHWRDCLHTLLCSDSVWRGEENRLVALQVLQVWLLNFELRGYWRQDAREAVNRLCASLGLPAETTLNHSYRA